MPHRVGIRSNEKEGKKMAEWVQVGETAPDFDLASDQGSSIQLSSYRGKPIVVYFYPKDDTPGCTVEACAFRDRRNELQELGAEVFGISPDPVESHVEFSEKFNLNFPLLADENHEVAEAFGAWREKTRNGQTKLGVHRSTFLIDSAGVIRNAWTQVDVEKHDEEVISALKAL